MRWIIFLLVLFCWSCVPENGDRENSNAYYNINGLIDEQIILLSAVSPSISKKATIGDKEEVSDFSPQDSTGWAKELMIFKAADINRSIYRDSYTTTETSDSKTTTITYESKDPESTDVDELLIQLEKSTEKALKIHAVLNNKNELFKSAKTLDMAFKEIDEKMMLFRYKIVGRQQMVSMDSTAYLIEVEINY